MEDKRTFGQKLDDFLMKDSTFILLIMGAAAAIFAGTFMYIHFGTGAFNDISIVAMLKDGLDGGDYAAAAGFAAGFLIARILEGPLVGLLDIGGYLAPLIVIAASSYNVYTGIGAILGAAVFYKWGKEMTGGAILGAMILGGIFL